MRFSIVALFILLLCGYILSSDHKSQSEESIHVLPRVPRRTIKCYQGPICQRFIDCLRFIPKTDCK